MPTKSKPTKPLHAVVVNPSEVRKADLIVGIPSYNEADNIAVPTDIVSRGLDRYFSHLDCCIINVDNASTDGTKEVFLNTPTRVPKIYISTPPEVKGKGNNLRNLFRATVELEAQAAVVVDADLTSITPEWIRYLAEPLFAHYDYVTPIYVRHKYDGTITNHIAYPMLRTLYGKRVRQPIGGDFGFSQKLARAFLSSKIWTEHVAHFGIDIWMTTIALARHFKVCQAFLGSPKTHRVKDPSEDLSPMFIQVVATIFDLMIEFEFLWKYISESSPTSIFGFGLGVMEQPPEIQINAEKLFQSFQEGYHQYKELWKSIFPPSEWLDIKKLVRIKESQRFYYASSMWARIVFNFAVAYRNTSEEEREDLIRSFIPFYHSRILSYINKTLHHDTREAEEYLENIVRIFEREKYYLIERWDSTANAHTQRLFP